MRELNIDEKRAVKIAADAMMDDVRAFDFANASQDDIYEFLGYAYKETCAALREIYDKECPF